MYIINAQPKGPLPADREFLPMESLVNGDEVRALDLFYNGAIQLKAYFENDWLATNLFPPAPSFTGSFRVNS